MAKASTAKRKRIPVPIYDAVIWVTIAPTIEEGVKSLPPAFRSAFSEDDGNSRAIFYYDIYQNRREYAIIFTSGNATGPVIHHETGHAARTILKDIGWKIDFDNDEPLAYLEEWINRSVTEACIALCHTNLSLKNDSSTQIKTDSPPKESVSPSGIEPAKEKPCPKESKEKSESQ